MNGYPQTKVPLHGRWLLSEGRAGGAKHNTAYTTTLRITTSDIHTEYNVMHYHNYVCYGYLT